MVVGIHTPETAGEKVTANVVQQVKRLGITYPVLLDSKSANWNRWGQQYWPTVYLIDKQGKVRYRWAGELEYEGAGGEQLMGACIQRLLEE